MTGAEAIVRVLRTYGITTVFGYPGGAIMPLYDALYESEVEHLLCRHEQGAAFAAIGYARTTGKVGVAIATSGPGATNLLTGLADASFDSVPIVAITGQVPRAAIGTDAFQEADVLGLSLACTKHSYVVDKPGDLVEILSEALFVANSGRPGPVLVDIPKDVQIARVPFPAGLHEAEAVPRPDAASIQHAWDLLTNAQRPLLYAGGGVGLARAVEPMQEFVKTTGIPSVCTLKGLGSVSAENPFYLGMLGMHGSKAANYAVDECDLLIVAGARFDDRVTGNLKTFAPNAKVIHFDIDPAEVGKRRSADVALIGDMSAGLKALSTSLSISEWQTRIASLKSEHVWRYDYPGEDIYAPALLHALDAKRPQDSIITADVGQHQMWVAQHMNFNDPSEHLSSSGLGTMGFGIPAAVGAQCAFRDRMVITVSGDGSFMMNVQELATVMRRELPIKIVLIDNQRLGMVRQWQQLFFEERYSETDLSDNPDFIALAKAFGIPGESICRGDEIEPALDRLLSTKTPYLLHVVIDANQNVWPLVPPGASNTAMLEEGS